MNFKNLFKLSTLAAIFLLVLSSFSFGQTTYYVDVQNGLDGYNGLQPTVGAPPNGPKATIQNAITAASSGDIISVAYANGNLYNENVVLGDKKLTFTSTGGTPNVVSFTVNNTLVAPDNITTFTGPFKFNNGLTLTLGKVIGATNLTVGAAVTRTLGSVDGQLNYSGVVNFTYNGGAAVTSGGELPDATNTTNFGALTTVGATPLTLNSGKTMNGILTTASTLNLGGNTLAINGDSTPHAIGGNVSNGTIAFGLTGNVVQNGAFNLPNVTASGAFGLTLNAATTVGNITASSGAGVTVVAATTVGNVTNQSSGAVALQAATTIASLTNNSSGSISVTTVGAYNVTGNVSQSGSGFINFNGGAATIAGSVTNNPAFTLTDAVNTNKGYIAFTPNVSVTINGQLTVNPTFAGATGGTGSTNWTNNGDVRFLSTATNVTITGGVSIGTTSTISYGGTAGSTVSTNGGVSFATTTGNILIPGGVTISTNWPDLANVTDANNGNLTAAARTTGLFGTVASRVGAINVTSSGANGANGNFLPGTGGGFNGTNVTTSGGAGGLITFGNEAVNLSGSVTNSRTSAANHISFGTAQTANVNVTIGQNLSNLGSSNIVFPAFVGGIGNETFTVTGTVKVTGGTVAVDPAAPLNGTGTFQFGGIELSGGTLDLVGAGTSNMDVLVNGPAKFYGGTFDVNGAGALVTNTAVTPIVIAGGDRVLQLGGLQNEFSTATGRTTFVAGNTLLLIQPTAIVAAQTVTGNLTTTVYPGTLVVKNPTFLMPAVTFSGGNFRALGGIAFDLSQVKIDNVTLFIGGQLAPNVGTASFFNHAGYVTTGQGFVSMNNLAGGGVFGGAGTFENFEVDCLVSVTANAGLGAFTKTFNLTNGNVLTSANVNFNNATNFPTIVRNAGTFAAAPTFTTMVNVIYIGVDKATANELPAAADKLNNLTVATTNDGTPPLVAGKGAVQVAVATTVNGTLEVYDNQALIINGVTLTLNGATVKLNNSGIIANVNVADQLVFNRGTGTTVTGSGWLPDVSVAAGSTGNLITGAKGLVTNFFGTDFSFGGAGGAADFDPTAAAASGSITFGAGTAGLQVVFGTGALNGTNVNNITTANASNTLQISSNLTEAGNIAHTAGTVAIDAGFTWSYRGLAPAVTGGAAINGPGLLSFRVGPTLFSSVASSVTVAAPVEINLGAAATTFTLDPANAGNLILSGDFTVTQGTVVLGNNATARNLTLTGKNFTLTGNSSFAAHNGAAAYILGTLILNPAAANAPMNWSYTGAPTVGNVTITNDVTLGGDGTALTVYRTFTHNGGKLDFSNRNLTIDGVTADIDPGIPVLAAAGTFNRTATGATYAATTGYLIIKTATFNQGTDFSIPNLRFGVDADAVSPTFGTASNATVTSILFVDVAGANTITHTVGGSARLNVSTGATVYYNDGKFDVAPTYAGTIILHSVMKTGATRAIHATVWPATAGLVKEFNLHNAPFGGSTNLPGGRQVNTQLTLTSGNLNLAAGTQVLTLADNLLVKVVGGTVTLGGGGSVVYGNNLNYSYEITAAYNTAAELASSVKDMTFTRTGNVVNAAVTLNKTVTINGTLTIRNDLTIPVAPPTVIVTALGDVNIALDAAYSNATIPVTNFNQSLVFGGANNATINVPAATPALNIGAITINKTNNTNTVTLAGGNLTTGTVTFVNGLIVTGSNILFIPAPTTGAVAGGAVSQGFTRAGVTGNNISHVVGNVGKTLINTGGIGASTEARSVFPVGTNTVYRPAAVNFNPAFGVPTNPNTTIVVSHVDSNPNGAAGLPIKDGVAQGIDVARYPNFYWNIYTTPNSVGPTTQFDLELTGGNFTDFDDPANVRIIRRHGAVGDINNAWLLQGANNAYDNEVNSITGFTAVNRGANAGLRSGGAVFTFGIKSNMSVNPASALAKYINTYKKIWLVLSGGVKNYNINDLFTGNIGTLSFLAQSSNPAVVTTSVTGSTLKLTPVAIGDAVVTVTAVDAANNDFFVYSFDVNVGPTDVKVEEGIPTDFSLSQNYPNPFNPSTTIKFGLPKESNVTLKIYNILGEEVANLVNEVMQAGFHTVNFDASRLASGMYIYRIQAGSFTEVKKMLLMK